MMLSLVLLNLACTPVLPPQDLAEIEKTLSRAIDKDSYENGAYQAAKTLSNIRSEEAMQLRLELFDEKLKTYRGVFLRDWFFSGMLKAESREELALVANAAANKKNSDLLRWVCLRALAAAKGPVPAKPLLSSSLAKAKDERIKKQWARTLGKLLGRGLLSYEGVRDGEGKALKLLAEGNRIGLAQLANSDMDYTASVLEAIRKCKDEADKAELLRTIVKDERIDEATWVSLLSPHFSTGKANTWSVCLRAAAIDITRENQLSALCPTIIQGLENETKNGGGRFAVEYGDLLMDLTGLKMGRTPEVWRRWWNQAGKEWLANGGKPQGETSRPEKEQETVATMFGVPVYSHNLVIMIDGSGSMNDPLGETTCLEAAKREMNTLLERLSDKTMFDVVVIEKEHFSAFGKLTANTPKNRKRALEFLNKRPFRSTSALFDSLIAIQKDWQADTILLIGDGGSSAGTHQYSGHILSGMEVEHARSGVKVHTICTTSQKSKLSFMSKLATLSGGTMVMPPG